MPPVSSRRNFLAAGAAALAALSQASSGEPVAAQQKKPLPQKGAFPVKAVASANGLEATKRAYEQIMAGQDTLDAAVAGVELVEDDPNDTSVGFGGLPNEDGVVELDAAVMHGPTHRAGAVASVQGIRHVSRLAQIVLERTDHVLLVAEGAVRFAKAHGFKEENLLTDKARKIWLHWKETLSDRDDWLPPPAAKVDPDVMQFFKSALPLASNRPTGTIHLAAMNKNGDLSCVTTTSGLAFKIPGRVGDSPIIGAGLYADNEVGTCGSTGRGEANLQDLCSFLGVEFMRGGLSPKEAGLEVLKRVAAHTEPRLRDQQGRPDFGLKFYLIGKDGSHAGVSLWGPAKFAVTDAKGTRLEDCAFLYEKKS